MEVLFEYFAAEYRCIIYTQKSKLSREIEQHLSRAGVAEPKVVVLSYMLSGQEGRHDERTEFFCKGGTKNGSPTFILIRWRKWLLVID